MNEHDWISKHERSTRRIGRSTVGGKTASEIIAEHIEALRNMTPTNLRRMRQR